MFMSTKVFLSALCLVVASGAMSQVSFGVQGGGIYSMARVKQETSAGQFVKGDPKFGWQAGLVADIPFGEGGLRLMPELNYINKGFKINSTFDILGQTVTAEGSSVTNYVELPLNLAYTIPVGDNYLVIGAGPYGAYGINGKRKVSATVGGQTSTENDKISFGSGEDQDNRFDYGVNFMAGYLVGNGLMVKLNYSLGLAELSNSSARQYKNSYLGLSVGYFFKKAGK
jgi:Outer membrane protein beta-barrel domain